VADAALVDGGTRTAPRGRRPIDVSPEPGVRETCYRWLLEACRHWLLAGAGVSAPASVGAIPDPDWTTLGAMAHYQGVEPILHLLARRPPVSRAPDTLRQVWERAYYGTRIRNSETLAVLAALVAGCELAATPVVVLKGPAIMADVHGDIGLRPMADLDVLCPLSRLLEVRDILRTIGFDRAGTPYLYQVDFRRTDPDLLLELHFDLHRTGAGAARFLESAFRDRATAAIEDWTFPVLSREHAWVFEVGHCAWHGFELDLRHVIDLAGRLLPAGAAFDRQRLIPLLEQTGLAVAHGQLVKALGYLLDDPLEREHPPDPFTCALIERSMAIGFGHARRTGSAFRRERRLGARAQFAWRRLVPPLAAMQAAYGLRTPAGRVLCLPVHLSRTLRDLRARSRAGF
jgi:hypothetical protein